MLANRGRLHYYGLSSKATCEKRAKYLRFKDKMFSEISRTILPVWAIKLARLPSSPSMGNISRLWIWASGITENKQNQKGRCRNCCLEMSYEVFISDARQNQGFRQCCRRLREMIMTQKDCPVRARPICLPSAGWPTLSLLYTLCLGPRPWQTQVICCSGFLNDFRCISRSLEEQDRMYSCPHIKDNCAFVLDL